MWRSIYFMYFSVTNLLFTWVIEMAVSGVFIQLYFGCVKVLLNSPQSSNVLNFPSLLADDLTLKIWHFQIWPSLTFPHIKISIFILLSSFSPVSEKTTCPLLSKTNSSTRSFIFLFPPRHQFYFPVTQVRSPRYSFTSSQFFTSTSIS